MKKIVSKKLSLSRESLRRLDAGHLARAQGAILKTLTCGDTLLCPTMILYGWRSLGCVGTQGSNCPSICEVC